MSVYTPQQVGQPQLQQPYGQQQPWGQQGLGQFNQQPLAQQGQLPLLVTEVSLRCAATAVAAVVEQLRMDPQILAAIQAQGQIPPHAWSSVLTECARRIAPVVHTVLAQITGQGPVSGYGPQPQSGQVPGGLHAQIPFGQGGQFQGHGGFGQMPPLGM